MPSILTKAQQYTLVGDGLAIGCHDLNIAGLTAKQFDLEHAFEYAWRDFPVSSTLFSQVKATPDRCDLLAVLHDSLGRRMSRVAWAINERWWEPTPKDSLDWIDVSNAIDRVEHVSRNQWRQFAGSLAHELGDQRVRRTA